MDLNLGFQFGNTFQSPGGDFLIGDDYTEQYPEHPISEFQSPGGDFLIGDFLIMTLTTPTGFGFSPLAGIF